MTIAKRSVRRFAFRYASIGENAFPDYRNRTGQPGLSDLDSFVGLIAEKLSDPARKALIRAQKRYKRYEDLVTRVLARSSKSKWFNSPKRAADVEAVILKAVIDSVASRNKDPNWTFRTAGLTQLSDDFLLLLEYSNSYDSEDLRALCRRFGYFFLSQSQQMELKAIPDQTQRNARKLEMLKPIVRPVWLLFVALCHSLQEGEEHELTATDTCWLGLIDEVMGQTEPGSLRTFMEWEPDPTSGAEPTPELQTSETTEPQTLTAS
jgi:hypothetical protein